MSKMSARSPTLRLPSVLLRGRALAAVGVFLALAFALAFTITSAAASPAAASSAPPSHQVKVYFSRFSDANDQDVYPVVRAIPTQGVGTYSIQLLIAGPTPEERAAGYYSELNSLLTGPSLCSAPQPTGGPDVTLRLDRRGATPETGTATLRFCRALSVPGIGAAARVTAQITATLRQFPRIQRVVILTSDGHCFGDESGQDRCLK
jgi:hypothetical protein